MNHGSADTQQLHVLRSSLDAAEVLRRHRSCAASSVVPKLRAVVMDEGERHRAAVQRERQGLVTRTVLVVDGNLVELRRTVEMLKHALGVPVFGASNPGVARTIWNRERCGVTVVEVFLPGGETAHQLLSSLGRVRAVLLGGTSDPLTLRVAAGLVQAIPLTKSPDDLALLPEHVRRLLDEVLYPVWASTDEDNFVVVSDAFAALLGYTHRELTGRSWRTLVHPDDLLATGAAVAHNIKVGSGVQSFINRCRRADGTWARLSWDCTPQTQGLFYCEARVVE